MTEASSRMGHAARNDKTKGLRHLVTPEGVNLRLQLASGSERMGAIFLDVFFILLGLTVAQIVLGLFWFAVGISIGYKVIVILWLIGGFLLRVFYFPWFELGPRAATPGKRIIGIRVAPRNGGRLNASAILARNATREIEIFLPLSFLINASQSGQSGVDIWIIVAGCIWTLIFALFPLFNRDHLRAGDMIAGTWVIKAPKRRLEDDLSATGEQGAASFTAEQLDAYGVRELHVLEDILRAADTATLTGASQRIREKIRRPAKAGETDHEFLNAYYTALRDRLEKRLLYGVRRRDKHDRR